MSLQAIDRELQELEQSLSSVAGHVEQLRQEIDVQQAELDHLLAEDQQGAVNRRQLERELAEGEARMRPNQVRNDKELQALAHEVETQKETNQRLEAELLAAMEAAEPRTPKIKELSEALGKKRSELTAAGKEIASQVEDLKVSIRKQKLERDQMAGNIGVALLSRYEMIFSRRNGLAVAEAKGGTCQGCRMRLPPQLYNEIQRHSQVHFCPNCQRILYYEG